MRHGVPVALLAAILLASGCSDDERQPEPAAATPSETPAPAYDAALEPAAAVLSLVPADAETLTVTDFDQVRAELGVDELDDQSPPEEVAAFWQRAETERPLLTTGLLRPSDARLARTYGFTELDVAWEAHFFDADGREQGWVLRLRDGTDVGQVTEATRDPATPISGAVVNEAEALVTSGTTDDPAASWAADPQLVALVGPPANSTYVSRSCLGGGGSGDLEELGSYSVQFEGSLVTARLGEGRHDLFARMRLGESEPGFDAVYDGGVADPATGRIGYVMTDPVRAAGLALEQRLPFATCP